MLQCGTRSEITTYKNDMPLCNSVILLQNLNIGQNIQLELILTQKYGWKVLVFNMLLILLKWCYIVS